MNGRVHVAFEFFDAATTGLSGVANSVTEYITKTFAAGTGADQVAVLWSQSSDIDASGVDSLDLIGGGLQTGRGVAVSFAKVRAILIRNTGTVAINVAGTFVGLGGGTIPLRPGGLLLMVAPDSTAYAVAAGSTDTITLTNTSGSTVADYEIAIAGS